MRKPKVPQICGHHQELIVDQVAPLNAHQPPSPQADLGSHHVAERLEGEAQDWESIVMQLSGQSSPC